ncbi:thiol:disulfide interchange protein DsbA/DsbL [Ramlibacter tataouinensis]|uniref:thiol:disulfide interchange protein DsbA/DsbL n=1 Tax=Ramlibacter tataouinensis TaxID=94132 RepID=UPI0022F38C7F|nr:thiol:disulfide interchange protein DsbA/DsbL [Ramlibacter tataouinensis]WBY03860.1 thiol:disulfide interchange protein DsbA/DsbL [Ramlibacter tataouinensis]
MNRREFSAGAACAVAAAGLGLAPLAWAQQKPEDGADYKTLDKRASTEAPTGKVEVVEFFWYACPHCNAFEPQLEAWQKRLPADVVLRRVPVAFRDSFVPQQRLFYTLEAMSKLDQLHRKVFHAIHVERQPLDKEGPILDWAAKNGLDKAKFQETYNSFGVSTKARKAAQLQDAYKVEGVPALGVAGRWYTDGSMAGSMPRAVQVAEFLIAEARKAR